MRATEALELSNPEIKLNLDKLQQITHIDLEQNWLSITKARQQNRRDLNRPPTLWD